jgi:hypothetical protein
LGLGGQYARPTKEGVAMEVTKINAELLECIKNLRQSSEKIFEVAKEKAETERDYRKALAVRIMELKDNKLPATLIPDLARGDTADIKFKRDLAEFKYNSARDFIEAQQTAISAFQSILRYQEDV